MEPQLVVVGLIVAVAALYLLRASVRTWAGGKKSGCGGGCGCANAVKQTSNLIETLEVRKRLIP